jgi:hypothetical protein
MITKPRPVTRAATNIGIAPITIDATAPDGILFEVEFIRIWHSVNDLSQSANFRTPRTYQTADSLASLCIHSTTLKLATDKPANLSVPSYTLET